MNIVDFEKKHIEEARAIALANYNEERQFVKELPETADIPDLGVFAENGLGVAAFENGKMIGYLCCYSPWDNAFDTAAKGTFSPLHAHGAAYENRETIYRRMYQAAAEKWVKNHIAYHGIALYAHDEKALQALFLYGFGVRCSDAIRSTEAIGCHAADKLSFGRLSAAEIPSVRELRRMLSEHMGESPCFMYSDEKEFQGWLEGAEKRESAIYAAQINGAPVSFIEVTDDGENFVTETDTMKNICGAFCLPEYRGKGVFAGLLDYTLGSLRSEGVKLLGVDYESFNPTALGAWEKYFTPYTRSVVRRIDEGVLRKY
ncbi:MAG: GNAT family N-acetyltransferase [Oscillospiraceae bacterium]|nr:GNAT family N-acetyltransferase [Oscillospiraceae bacterium]